jgi:hypothetical protein
VKGSGWSSGLPVKTPSSNAWIDPHLARSHAQRDLQRVAGQEGQHCATVLAVAVVEASAGQAVADQAAPLVERAADAGENAALDQWAAGHRMPGKGIVIAIAEAGVDIGVVGRLARDIVDRTRDRVLAVQRALWPAQHLHPLEIEQVHVGGGRAAEIDAVDEDTDALIEPGIAEIGADPANGDVLPAQIAIVDIDIGQHVREILDPSDARIRQRLAGDRGERDRRFLDVDRAVLRGDDDLLHAAGIVPDIALRERGQGIGRSEGGRERETRQFQSYHLHTPCLFMYVTSESVIDAKNDAFTVLRLFRSNPSAPPA